MHVPAALAACVIICHVLHSRQAEAETKGAIKYAAWEPLCLLTKDAVKLYGMAHKLNLDIDTYLYRSEADQVRLQVLLSRSENAKLQAAAAATIAAIQTDKTQVADKGGKCKLAAATLAAKAGYLHGRLAEFLEVMTAHRGTTNARGCLSKSTADDAASIADTVAAVSAKCQLAVAEITTTESKPTQLTLSGFPKLTDSNGLTVAADVGGSSNAECKLLSTTAADVVNDGNLAEPVPYAAGYMRRNMAMTAEGTAKLNSLATDPGDDAKTKTSPYYSLWEAYKEADGCRQAIEAGYTRPAAETLAGAVETKSAIKNYVLQKEGKYDQATDKEDDYKNLDKIFKDGKDFYPQKLWDAMDKKDVAKDATQTNEIKKLADITDVNELNKVLLYYTRQKVQGLNKEIKEAQEKATQANQSDAAAKAAEDACNKLVGEEKCNADPKCSYETETDGTKKCKFNETKATANGVPTTQAQTGGTEATTQKCKGKPEKDCKSPDCKWEDKTCKDSSILVNKRFALSVVSAAFVALLF